MICLQGKTVLSGLRKIFYEQSATLNWLQSNSDIRSAKQVYEQSARRNWLQNNSTIRPETIFYEQSAKMNYLQSNSTIRSETGPYPLRTVAVGLHEQSQDCTNNLPKWTPCRTTIPSGLRQLLTPQGWWPWACRIFRTICQNELLAEQQYH